MFIIRPRWLADKIGGDEYGSKRVAWVKADRLDHN